MLRLLFILLMIPPFSLLAQSDTTSAEPFIFVDRDFSVLFGYGLNRPGSHFGELGLAINDYGTIGFHAHAAAAFISTEFRVNQRNEFLIAPKIGGWVAGGVAPFAMGVNLLYYMGDAGSSLMFRPEIGVGMWRFKVTYGWNIPFSKGNFLGLERNQITAVFLLKAKKLKNGNANWF